MQGFGNRKKVTQVPDFNLFSHMEIVLV
jgi:hypothetical protein